MNSNTPVFSGPDNAGIAVRDWMAVIAMQGIITKGLAVQGDRAMTDDDKDDEVATRAYQMADAMLRARAKSDSPTPASSR